MKNLLTYLLLLFGLTANAANYYVSTTGNNGNPGTFAEPFLTSQYGIDQLTAGDTLFMRGGVYMLAARLSIVGVSGTAANPIVVMTYPDDHAAGNYAIMDAEGLYRVDAMWIRDVDHWKFWGITWRNARQEGLTTPVKGVIVSRCNQITFDQCVSHDNGGQGFRFESCDTIHVYRTDSYNNCDSLAIAPSKSGGAADGFQVLHNVVDTLQWTMIFMKYCRAWNNSDDGIDFVYDVKAQVDSCWIWNNGYLDGDGTGMKGGIMIHAGPSEQYIFRNNLSAFNKRAGFRDNNNSATHHSAFEWYNNTAAYNANYGFVGSHNNTITHPIIYRNNIAYPHGSKKAWLNNDAEFSMEPGFVYTSDHNSWDAEVVVSDVDFLSVDSAGLAGPRQADGSLPNLDFMKLRSTSDLVNAGVDVGLPYNGTAPDLGAFEFNPAEPPALPNVATGAITKLTPFSVQVIINITYAGGGTILQSGVCWGTSEDPTTADSKTEEGEKAGIFTTNATGLLKATTYYFRAYATNETGTSYGENAQYDTQDFVPIFDDDGTKWIFFNGKPLFY